MPELKQPLGLKPLWGKIQLLLRNATADVYALAETDGTIKNSVYGKAGGTLTSIKVETTGEQDVVIHGKTSGGTIGALRINPNNQLQVEIIEGSYIQVDPLLITNSESLLWNPNAASSVYYKVMFNIVNSSSSDVTGVNVGQDIGAGGSLSAAEYWVQGLIVPANGSSGWYGPFLIPGDDRVRGVAGTTNVLSIHWLIKQVA